MPLDFLVVQAQEAYCWERLQVSAAAACEFMLANLFRNRWVRRCDQER